MFQSPVFTGSGTAGDSAVSESGFCESCALPVNADTEDGAASRLVRIPAVQAGSLTASTGTAGRSISTDENTAPAGLFPDADVSGRADSCDACEIEANPRILLFVRQGCPSCPGAKAEAGKLAENFGVCLETVNADTEAGLAEARRLGVTATPTAILLRDDAELSRAKDRDGIAGMRRFFEPLKQSA
jgi:hypothetical protein